VLCWNCERWKLWWTSWSWWWPCWRCCWYRKLQQQSRASRWVRTWCRASRTRLAGARWPRGAVMASAHSIAWRAPMPTVRWCVGASRALLVPSVVSTWVPSPASPASAVSPCRSPSARPPTATSKLSSPFYSSMHVSVIHIIIYHLYWILNTCLHVYLVLCSGACRIA
jgi:hypothetical protein